MNEHRGLWRGKRLDYNDWVDGDLLLIKSAGKMCYQITHRPSCWAWLVDSKTLGECTGGTDKQGKLAFEGDLVKEKFNVAIGVIRYGEYKQPFNDDEHTKHIGFYVDWLENSEILRKDLGYWLPLVEIIGNIHDNPELIQKGAAE